MFPIEEILVYEEDNVWHICNDKLHTKLADYIKEFILVEYIDNLGFIIASEYNKLDV